MHKQSRSASKKTKQDNLWKFPMNTPTLQS